MRDTDASIAESHIDLEQRVRRRAHEIWMSHQGGNGVDSSLEDWLQAEREILGDSANSNAQNRGTVMGDSHVPDRNRIEELGEA